MRTNLGGGPVSRVWARIWTPLRRFHDDQVEMYERMYLLNSPWEEEYLHWAADGTLHGTIEPPSGRRRSVTRTGWCIGLRLDVEPRPGVTR